MTQALFTSMTGLNAGTEQLTVVSDNVANMNTTAYKTSRVDFQDIWYRTSTTGTNSSKYIGGTNPYQVGVGVKCSAITKDFAPSSINSTGRSNDLAIQGSGWFSVLNADGAVLLTRDGSFSLDENGYLVNATGCRVLGMDETQSSTRSDTPLKIPTSIQVTETATEEANFKTTKLDELNCCQPITAGAFQVTTIADDGTTLTFTVNIPEAATTLDVQNLVDNVLKTATCTDGGTTYNITDYVDISYGDGTISFAPIDGAAKDIEFSNVSGGSNFLNQTKLASVPLQGGAYTSKILNKSAQITEVLDVTADTTKTYKEFYIGDDGLVTATYSDGSTLSVKTDDYGTTYFQYIDSEGIVINDDINNSGNSPLWVDPNVLVKANMQLQMVKVTNDDGLVAVGSNMYQIGVNCGEALYTIAGINGVGSVATGALEASNVDLAQQFSNMILAQRLVQANSQVFSSANNMLETLVYLGRS